MGVKLTPAAAYIRMSGKQQDKSPAEQRAEITKLATREKCEIVEWFTDEAITGDSSTDARAAWLLCSAPLRQVNSSWSWRGTRTELAAKTQWTPSASTTNSARLV